MSNQTLADLIEVAPRFVRSINLENDADSVDALDGYVVSPLARDVLLRVVNSLRPDAANRAWALVGPYGSGKSSFATFLAALLDSHGSGELGKARELFEARWPEKVEDLQRSLSKMPGSYVVAPITAERQPLGVIVLRGLLRSARRYWATLADEAPKVLDDIECVLRRAPGSDAPSDHIVIRLTRDLVQAVARSGARAQGVCLIIDEFGKALEWAALHPTTSDINLLQQLAELASRESEGQLAVIIVLHQGIEAYATRLPNEARREWFKVEGRFEQIPYLEARSHLVRLVGCAIYRQDEAENLKLFKAAQDTAVDFATYLQESDAGLASELLACFPLNPVAASCLGLVFRLRLGQNERSLFAFLASSEPQGFQQFLAQNAAEAARCFCLDDLYDYLVTNTGVRFAIDGGDRIWSAAELALLRLPGDATALDARVIKSVAILALIERFVGPRANPDVLALALEVGRHQIDDALDRLSTNSIVVYRAYKNAYQLWDGSDLDISGRIGRWREQVRAEGGLGARLQKQLPPSPLVATRHGYQTGTLRYLSARYVDASQVPARLPGVDDGDGALFYVLGADGDELDAARLRVSKLHRDDADRPWVFAFPTTPAILQDAIVEVFAIDETLRQTPELDSDPVARRELGERRLAAESGLQAALVKSFGTVGRSSIRQWLSPGHQIEAEGRASSAASWIFDRVYNRAPVVRNELINRNDLSTAAARAQRILLERMTTHGDQLQLGIEGNPPELSMYLSLIQATGLHADLDDGRRAFLSPVRMVDEPDHPQTRLHGVWRHLHELLAASTNGRLSAAEIVTLLEQPPFGIRRGVGFVLLMAYYLTESDKVLLYEENSFVPRVQPEMAYRMLRQPQTIEFQRVATQSTLGLLLPRLSRKLLPRRPQPVPFLTIVRHVVRSVAALSPYASTTRSVSEQTHQVRNAIKSARDPLLLMTAAMPAALGIDVQDGKTLDEEGVEAYAQGLDTALRELADADQALLQRIADTLRVLLHERASGAKFYARTALRAKALDEVAPPVDMTPAVRRFVTVSLDVDADDPETQHIWLQAIGTAVLGRQPSQWTDQDVALFGLQAQAVCDQFRATEALALALGRHSTHGLRSYRVSVLDGQGNERTGVSVLTEPETDRLRRFQAEVRALAVKHGVEGADMAYAVIASMLEAAPGNEERSEEASP